ncbi:hypothetical protein BaRGS_00035508 [Batillaria attramentaria]|uniref:Uncharacterized protein n=1 Tax=Batillaria attramentaria TaxID=370345 RepID=A0ABD0JEJ3_9CAEN
MKFHDRGIQRETLTFISWLNASFVCTMVYAIAPTHFFKSLPKLAWFTLETSSSLTSSARVSSLPTGKSVRLDGAPEPAIGASDAIVDVSYVLIGESVIWWLDGASPRVARLLVGGAVRAECRGAAQVTLVISRRRVAGDTVQKQTEL